LSFAAYDDILKWARFATTVDKDIFNSNRPFPSRQAMMVEYRKHLGLAEGDYEFKETIVQWLPDNKPVVIHRRPFLDCLFELLTKESLLGPNSQNIQQIPLHTDRTHRLKQFWNFSMEHGGGKP